QRRQYRRHGEQPFHQWERRDDDDSARRQHAADRTKWGWADHHQYLGATRGSTGFDGKRRDGDAEQYGFRCIRYYQNRDQRFPVWVTNPSRTADGRASFGQHLVRYTGDQ